MKGFRTLRGSNHLEDMRKEPREEEPRALEWIFPGSAGSLPASPGDRPAFLARSGGGRYSSLEQSPNLRRKGERPQTRRHEGAPTPPLNLPLWAGPVRAKTPPPAHLSRARRRHPPPRTVTATSPRPATPSAGSARAQLAESPPATSGSARPPGPTIPDPRRLRRQRRCSSHTRSALPRSPRSRSPAPGDGSSSLRAPAASSRYHQAQGRFCRRRPRQRRLQSRSAPHPPPRNRKWLRAAANYQPGRHRGAGPTPAEAVAGPRPGCQRETGRGRTGGT